MSGCVPSDRLIMKRVGLFGGSFDPVHVGHIQVAQAAREQLGLDRVYFIPAAQSPFKPNQRLAPSAVRLRLLRLALAGRAWTEVDDQEIVRGGVSYTIDTIRHYRNRYPSCALFYLIGSDHVRFLPTWRSSEELAREVSFAVVLRPGDHEVKLPHPFSGVTLRSMPIGVSASEIRERIRQELPIDLMVPGPVAEAIQNNRLYL